MFGRWKKADSVSDSELKELEDEELAQSNLEDQEEDNEDSDIEEVPEEELDEWDELDTAVDRELGPFDISEVLLEADDVQRVDLGALVVTPFEGMKLQLHAQENTDKVQAILAMDGDESAIEVALLGAPKSSSVISEIRRNLVTAAQEDGGVATLVKGPFGTEIRRVIPVTDSDGNKGKHVSRVWLVAGPRWILRGVLVGKAGVQSGQDGDTLKLFEFFSNLVVRRGHEAVPSGEIIHLRLPE